MSKSVKVSEQITIGAQPTEQELERIKKQGFCTVVNFRTEGEDQQPLSPQAEGDRVAALGMEYLHLPVKDLTPQDVDDFRHALTNLPTPVFAHCKAGTRAGLMALMNLAVDREWNGEEAIAQGRSLGLTIDKPEHVDFVTKYADAHVTQT